MNRTKKWIIFCIIITGFYLVTGKLAGKDNYQRNEIIENSQKMKEIWHIVRNIGKDNPESKIHTIKNELNNIEKTNIPFCYGVEKYLSNRIQYLRNQPLDKNALLDKKSIVMYAENIILLMENNPGPHNKRLRYIFSLAELFPISSWQRYSDGYSSIYLSDIKPSRQIVPKNDYYTMQIIADLLYEAKLYDLAWRSYIESIYCCFTPAWPSENMDNTWLSEKTAEYWLKAAESAYKAGKQEIGLNYLVKSVVFGDGEIKSKAEKLLKTLLLTKISKTEKTIDAKTKRNALLKVVRLYMDLNAHPRALQLMDDFPKVFDKSEKLREEVEAEWMKIVENVSRSSKKVVLYGKEVYPNGDPLKIRIPWAFSENAINSVFKRLRETVDSGKGGNTRDIVK